MPKYKVTLEYLETYEGEIEADSEDEAIWDMERHIGDYYAIDTYLNDSNAVEIDSEEDEGDE